MTKLLPVLAISGILAHAFGASALSGGVSGSGTVQSAIPIPHKALQVDLGGSYFGGDNMALRSPDNRRDLAAAGAQRLDYMTAIAYGLTPYLETSLLLPYYRDTDNLGTDHQGLGDMRLSFKYNYPPYPHKEGFKLSFLLQLDMPTATHEGGGWTRNAWYVQAGQEQNPSPTKNAHGTDGMAAITQMLATANFGAIEGMWPLLLHLNWGMAFSGASSQNAFVLGGGMEATPHPMITGFFSMQSQITVSGASKNIPLMSYPFQSSAGLQFNIPQTHIGVYGGAHFALNSQPTVVWGAPRDAAAGTALANRAAEFGLFAGVSAQFDLNPKTQAE